MITLYHAPRSRSSRFLFLLEELGARFSAADILVGTIFKLFLGSPLLPRTDLLEAYVQRVTARPAYARTEAKDNG